MATVLGVIHRPLDTAMKASEPMSTPVLPTSRLMYSVKALSLR